MATIKPIEGKSVHQIQSGQVIVDICSVVKELVENSLDAGATTIEVRFKNQGLEAIEVQDNGSGITPENYETIALKHHTSKLTTYADLEVLRTFGFRGEALSSLCALSKFTIVTCLAADSPKGTKLEFETSGKLKSTSIVAAQRGTTVTVENLFKNLPVRRRELERNIKREWQRVITVIGQYACMQTGVKISMTSQVAKGKKSVLFSTKGNRTTKENIANVFGAKTLSALLPLNLKLELEPTKGILHQQTADSDETIVKITGHISRPNEGRNLPDRQMFYINSRPCGLPQFAKAFNEVYKSYTNSQSPFIFANIELDTHMYDVNVSPDKRTILLHEQNQMLEKLKEALTALFDAQEYQLPISQVAGPKIAHFTQQKLSSFSESGNAGTPRRIDESESFKLPGPSESPKGLPKARDGRSSSSNSSACEDKNEEIKNSEDEQSSKHLTSRDSQSDFKVAQSASSSLARSLKEPQVSRTNDVNPDSPYVDSTRLSPGESISKDEAKNIPIRDFNNRLSQFLSPGIPSEAPSSSQREESPIPMMSSQPQRQVPAEPFPTQRSIRMQRAAPTTAEITIGDHTITSSIGSPLRKRQKLFVSEDSGESEEEYEKPKTTPFGSRLSQRFSASSTTSRRQTQDAESEDEEAEISDEEYSWKDTSKAEFNGSDLGDISEVVDADKDECMHREDDHHRCGKADVIIARSDLQNLESVADTETSGDEDDEDFVDDETKKAQEEAKVQGLIQAAEKTSQSSLATEKRAGTLLTGAARKESTFNLVQEVAWSIDRIKDQMQALQANKISSEPQPTAEQPDSDKTEGEEKLSLTIEKGDFSEMRIIGQFNLGFILAVRPAQTACNAKYRHGLSDELFIIDQHASDEKYNFERLQAITVLQPQQLVRPKTLSLTAVEEEIVIENKAALESNGFIISVDESGESPVGQRCQLKSLPVSRETAFSLSDLEELLGLLIDRPAGSIPRPSKVRSMFAMRACRSSIMVGRTLTTQQMATVVRHMGELDKPWNCPHGRPTMRHLCGLSAWDEVGWREGDTTFGTRSATTNWNKFLKKRQNNKV